MRKECPCSYSLSEGGKGASRPETGITKQKKTFISLGCGSGAFLSFLILSLYVSSRNLKRISVQSLGKTRRRRRDVKAIFISSHCRFLPSLVLSSTFSFLPGSFWGVKGLRDEEALSRRCQITSCHDTTSDVDIMTLPRVALQSVSAKRRCLNHLIGSLSC